MAGNVWEFRSIRQQHNIWNEFQAITIGYLVKFSIQKRWETRFHERHLKISLETIE